jgi:predicted nucleotidyltransferase
MMAVRLAEMKKVLTASCRRLYGEDLVSLAIFGSYARGTATPVSDIDLLVVAANLPRSRGKRLLQFEPIDTETEVTRAKLWKNEAGTTLLSPLIKTPDQVLAGSPLFLDMTEWCEILWDPNSFLQNYLMALTTRMRELGTTRKAAKGGYYWDYKPDLQPGEVVDL